MTDNQTNSILVVDDNPTNIQVLVDYLNQVGFEVLAAEDGESALEQLDYFKPDIILLDVMMPGLDGYETCRQIKASPDLQRIPVIFMTALSEADEKVRGFEAGAVDYVTKPLQHNEVLARINTHLTVGNLRKKLEQTNQALVQANDELEARVQDRTRRLQLLTEMSTDLSGILDLSQLLSELIKRIQQGFNYYHVHIYLLEEATQELVMVAGAGEVGLQLRMQNHRLAMGEGIVGTVAQTQTHFLSNDVEATPNFVRNTLLPNTQSELAVPLRRKGGMIIGVLDIQHEQVNGFTAEDVSLMQSIANLAATAIDNAQLMAERQQMITELARLDEAKSQFIVMISHELRTPMSAVIGFSELLINGLSGEMSEAARRDVEVVYLSGKQLLGIINDIVDITKIEAGDIEINLQEAVNTQAVIEEVARASSVAVKDKPIRLEVQLADNLPTVKADPLRLRQILSNLINNAIKFTKEGTVTVKAEPQPDQVQFSVIDTGIGIPPHMKDKIFNQFQQVDMSDARQYGGMGLGLPLCQKLVHLQGGRIWVHSTENRGSEFHFTLPTASGKRHDA